MFNIGNRRLVWGLYSYGKKDGHLYIKDGAIIFETDENGRSHEYIHIMFTYRPSALLHTSAGDKSISCLDVDVPSKKIRTFDKDEHEWIELGFMEDFKTPEEALRILEKFIEDNTVKENP